MNVLKLLKLSIFLKREGPNLPAEYELIVPRKSTDKKSASLDPNHTHFILVDSVKEDEFGGEIKFRTNVEESICKRFDEIQDFNASFQTSLNIPTVLLVLGGGRNTVRQVLSAIEKNIPCIIFDETGKFANIISHILKLVEKNEAIFKPVKEKLKDNDPRE